MPRRYVDKIFSKLLKYLVNGFIFTIQNQFKMPTLLDAAPGNTVIQISPAIEFTCRVEGKVMKATLTHEEENGYQVIYQISFCDGHTGTYFGSEEDGKWIESGKGPSEYAKAIDADLNAICGFDRSNPPFCISADYNKEVFNVWVVPSRFDKEKHSVHYQNDFRFYLYNKSGEWQPTTVERHKGYINQNIAEIVKQNITLRSVNPISNN